MKVNLNYSYNKNDDCDYVSRLERINLDEERENDIYDGKGFLITHSKAINKDVKDPNSIFSTRYGNCLEDPNPFIDRYRCSCGHLKGKVNEGQECPICKSKVKYVGDKFDVFGYIVLKDPYYLIHPSLYWSLAFFIGEKEFMNIITPYDPKDEDGNTVDLSTQKNIKDEPFYGIGLLGFHERFDEIMEYYHNKRKGKQDYYDNIMIDKDKVFTRSIPVYTTLLRPFRLENGEFHFEGTNAIFNLMAKIRIAVNRTNLEIDKKRKPKNQLLFDLQMKWRELDDEITKILAGKKGTIRSLFGGRYNFTARSVIVPSPKLGIDEVTLGYQALCGLLQQGIINILCKAYGMSYNRAYQKLQESLLTPSEQIMEIIKGYIRDSGRGIPILINRNPSIAYGSLVQMYVVDVTETYTMGLPLQICPGMGADFDGDTLNILYIINKDFQRRCEMTFNPRNAMMISKNDGYFNMAYMHQKDVLINGETMIQLGRENYTEEDIKAIKDAQAG